MTVGAFGIYPDYALVIDVNLAKVPDVPERETVPMGEGVSVSLSAVTDRKLTARVIEMCEKEKIRFTKCVSASSTGTNAVPLNIVGEEFLCATSDFRSKGCTLSAKQLT